MTKSNTKEIIVRSPVSEIELKQHAILIMHNANRRDLRSLNKQIKSANPDWTGGVVALNQGENLTSLTNEQAFQWCIALMARFFPELYKKVRAELEQKLKDAEEGASDGQEPDEGNPE